MTKVTISEDCENAPKKEFIKDFNIAFAKEDIDYILDCFADGAHWEMVGAQSWDGKEEIAKALKTMNGGEASELIIDSILSHGDKCAANGILKYPDGSSVAYCDIYTFTGHAKDAKIKTLKAYAIDIKQEV
jgi:hypothetical protein